MHHLLARHCEYFSEDYIQGKLFEVDDYPGAIESDELSDSVWGEIYRIINREVILPKLDQYEECTSEFPQPYEYLRKKLIVTLSGGGSVSAWVYVFNHGVANLAKIFSGDYLSFIKSKSKKS